MKHLFSLFFAFLVAGSATAATISIVVQDGPAEGFNDPTPAVPVGGNPGITVGQQRLNVFQRAAEIWGARLASSVPILVGAKFDPLSCTTSSGVLGSCGAHSYFRDFVGAPRAGTYYPVALANALAGEDLDPGAVDMDATFNSELGTSGCLSTLAWYYGLEGDAPSGTISLLDVVLHEFCHGLGFVSTVSLNTGSKLNGYNDTFMLNLEDHTTGKLYPNMTDSERSAASVNTGNLHWVGSNVVAASGILSAGRHPSGHVQMYAPNPVEPGSSVSHFDTALFPNELMEPFINPALDRRLTTELFRDIGWGVLPAVAASGQAIVGESCANGAIDPAETVTVNLSLRNFGFSDTANLTATLLATNGVVNPGSPQNYGSLLVAGPAVARAFTFTATGQCGTVISPALKLMDGTNDYGTVRFTFRLGVSMETTRATAITTPNSGTANLYPSTITISNYAGSVHGLSVRLNNVSHGSPDDLDILLVGPQGQKVLLMSDAGGGADISNVTLTFSDEAAGSLGDATQITTGVYKPSNYGSGDSFPAPAPGGFYENSLSVFDGTNPNGTWQLYVIDDRNPSSGSIAAGWTLLLPSCCTPALVASPVLTFNPAETVYVENDSPVALLPDALVSDNDSLHFNGGSLTVSMVTNSSTPDRLLVLDQGVAVGLVGSSGGSLTFGGLPIGTISGGTNGVTPLQVSFTSSNATLAAVQAVCRAISFANVSETPATNLRTVRLVLNDGSGGSVSVSKQVRVTAINDPPGISMLSDLSILEDASTGLLPLVIGDPDNGATTLLVSAVSSNPELVPSLLLSGTGSNRFLAMTPKANAFGSAVISVWVSDGAFSNSVSFNLSVLGVNDPPTLDLLTNQIVLANSGPFGVHLSGISAGATNEIQTLDVTAFVSSGNVLQAPVVTYVSPAALGLVTIQPLPDAFGTSVVSVVVTDDGGIANGGRNAVTNQFQVIVRPVADIATHTSMTYDGTNLLTRITVTNGGPHTATALTMTNLLPANTTVLSIDSGGEICQSTNGRVLCEFASLPSGAAADITLKLSVVPPATLTNVIMAGAAEFDPDASNNLATATLVVTDDTDGDGLPDAWEQLNNTNPNLPDADADPDGDGLTNLQEFRAGTDPNDSASNLRLAVEYVNGEVTLVFTSLPGRSYSILYSTNLGNSEWTKLADSPAVAATNLVRIPDPAFNSHSTRFYRLLTPQQP